MATALRAFPRLSDSRACRNPRCVAVVVHWRGAEDTLRCVSSLRSDASIPIVVVDNASEDGSGAVLAGALRGELDVVVTRAPGNRGFGSGCNLGVSAAFERWPELGHTLLLNPDAVVEPGCVQALLATADRHPRAGIVGGRVLDASGRKVLYENGRVRRFSLSRSHVPAPSDSDEYPTEFITGALMLVDADLWRAGLRFDERYFLYVEDLDLCCSVRNAGRELWVTRHAQIRHAEGGSQLDDEEILGGLRAQQLEHMTRGKVLFARKHLRWHERFVFWVVALAVKPSIGLGIARSPRFLGPYFRGLASGLRERITCSRDSDR